MQNLKQAGKSVLTIAKSHQVKGKIKSQSDLLTLTECIEGTTNLIRDPSGNQTKKEIGS